MTLPLLQTKLYAPPPRPHLVPRPHLIAHLQAWEQRPLTLISAPAGFGKTTLVSAWLVQTACPAAWLALDEEDNDLTRFLLYLITALQSQQPALGGGALALLGTPQPPAAKTILMLLLNELATRAAPLILILDDYHAITTPAIHDAVAYLIDHLPRTFHLVITTRIDPPLPLARWRVRNQLTEIRADDLRFTSVEATRFLNQVMGLALTESQIATLETRTEGWIAGLQLAALSMQGRADVADFIEAFSGSHRHVLSYLVEEVLNHCPADVLDFLLQTSILARLSAPLCDAVMGRTDSQQRLEQIEAGNLFLIPLDDARQWYRYHHLFADVLQQRLQRSLAAEAVVDLHLRASTWYTQAALIDAAVHHALAAQAFDRAAALVEQVASELIQQSELVKLLGWHKLLPAAEVRSRPQLGLYFAWGLFLSGQVAPAIAHLEAAEAVLEADKAQATVETRGLSAGMRAYLLRATGDLAVAIALSQQALTYLPVQDSLLRAMVNMNLAIAHYLAGAFEPAADLLTQIIATGQSPQRMATTLSAMYLYTQLLRGQGRLQQAWQLCQEGLAMVARQGWQDFPAVGFLYVACGDLLRERNELPLAREYLEKGIALGQAGGHPHVLIISYVWLAWLCQTEGDATGSQENIRAALQVVEQYRVSRFWPLPSAANYQARLWITQGKLADANRWAQSSDLNQAQSPIPYLDEAAYITLARLQIAEGRFDVAEALLHRLHKAAAEAGRNGSLIEILILQAITCAAQQQSAKAMPLLAQSLSLAGSPLAAAGYVRLFVDEGAAMRFLILDFRFWVAQQPQTEQNIRLAIYADQLLTNLRNEPSIAKESSQIEQSSIQNPKSKIQNLVEPLSDREQEVLQLVAQGLSNSQIADRLIVTTGTVKTHLNRIFGKLAVQSRTQAIMRGRELGLLPD